MSLRKLAKSLGLSPTTVSRALNGYPDVSAQTRARVQQAAREHRYAPDPRARSLATGRSMAIGHILPAADRHEIVNPVFADFIAGASETYAAAGYEIVLSVMPEGDEADGYASLARSGRVDGLLLQIPRPHDPRIALLSELGVPFVVHGRASASEGQYAWLDMDNRRAFARATRHLTDLGHRRIALLNGPDGVDFTARRAAGYAEAMAQAGHAVPPDFVQHAQMTEVYGYSAARALIGAAHAPTAFVTASLLIAMGVSRATHEAGLRLGHDISVVTHDDGLGYLPNGTPEAPVFTATRVPVHRMGVEAAAMLLTAIAAPGRAPETRLIEAEFITGPSSGPPPDQPRG